MLCYPELYVIDGGYKAFYEKYAHLCTPRGYLPMLHRDCQQAMRRYRAQCKRDSKALKQMDGSRSLVNQLGGATLRF
jgi:hypothetical protein